MGFKKKYTNCDEVYKSLQKYFSLKCFESGDRVPCERKIAEDLDVNRTTLRSAMHRMVVDGLLDRKIGVGTFFKISPDELRENYTKINTKCDYIEVLETRMILEPQIAHIAALNVSDDDIKKLKQMCRISDKDFKALEKIDIEFHDMIASLSKNSMLHQMYDVISNIRKKISETTDHKKSCSSYECAVKWKGHQENIIGALEKRNSQAAYDAVKEKLENLVGERSVLD